MAMFTFSNFTKHEKLRWLTRHLTLDLTLVRFLENGE